MNDTGEDMLKAKLEDEGLNPGMSGLLISDLEAILDGRETVGNYSTLQKAKVKTLLKVVGKDAVMKALGAESQGKPGQRKSR